MTDIPRDREVFTVAEAAQLLRISEATVYRLAAAGDIPHRKIRGTGIRFTGADIDKILADALRGAAA